MKALGELIYYAFVIYFGYVAWKSYDAYFMIDNVLTHEKLSSSQFDHFMTLRQAMEYSCLINICGVICGVCDAPWWFIIVVIFIRGIVSQQILGRYLTNFDNLK